ncbi:MAG: site-2 protease family protein [Opitutaceae bacterium]|jgi:Zn-dependent protease
MTPTRKGSFHLFNLAGIDVHLHWSWFLVAVIQISNRPDAYVTPLWKVWEYLGLFLIVLMHEFGHSLACRQVGGTSDQIVLWPLGGVAYVNAPQRPGATLWSIAAGPLVNVVLAIVSWPLLKELIQLRGIPEDASDIHRFLSSLTAVNIGLLIFNLMPVYPLDGGQILRSLLWFPFGRANSLLVAIVVGFLGGAALGALAIYSSSIWFGVMAAFILMNCWSGFKQARALQKISKLPRHAGFSCPSCKSSPPAGQYWGCGQCGKPFDIFASGGTCPHCGAAHDMATCVDCGSRRALADWKNPEL